MYNDTLTNEAGIERIIARYSDPYRNGTPAWRVNALIHDAETSRSLTEDWIRDQTRRSVGRGGTRTPALVACVARRVSIEALLHKGLGLPVNQIRAASLYQKRLALLHPDHPSFEQRCRIWDEAVLELMDTQTAEHAAGKRGRVRYLPLADGTSSSPRNPQRLGGPCGLAAWENLASRPRAARRETDWERLKPKTAAPAEGAHDAAWFAAHGIDRDMIRSLGAEALKALGATPPTPAQTDLGRVLGDAAARRIAGANPGMDAADMLAALGMDRTLARAGIAFERDRAGIGSGVGLVEAWNRAARPAGARGWSDGLARWRNAVARLRAEYCMMEDEAMMRELMGA